ncbi:unnamed protein product [Paramecium sonneborni]|uniref:PAS domain-containing protein n=1 Tax=Paramecium sonneborni TaxID=65129 RepID=A0A8S1LBK4_9CILI|nr:unnamed protein product [Paramecium sonneborni]
MDDEDKGFDNFLRKIKFAIFDVLAILDQGEEDSESLLLFYLQTAADYVQIHSFPFNQKIDYIWKASSFLEIVFTAFNILSIGNYLPTINYLTFILSVYFLLLIIFLMVLDIIYVSYSFSRQRFRWMWPVHVLRSGVSIVVTLFFLPITETLISLITCETNENGEYALAQFPTVLCWSGWHIFHAILASLFNLIFTIICSIVAYAFFEPKMKTKNRTSRQDSNGEVVFILNKVICQVLYSFLGPQDSWILIIVTFLLSLWLFKVYNIDDPYYDWEVGLFYNVISTYYLWTNSWLLICKILENTSFKGGLVAWLLGIPFIVSIMASSRKSKIDMLIRQSNKFKSGEEINSHIRYVLQLIQNQEKDKNSYMLLVGYIEKHKETCNPDECQLKEKNNKKIQQNNFEAIISGLLAELDKLFQQGLEKFPQSTQLRISYAFFLIERLNNKKKAHQQFLEAQKFGRPAFDQEFIIYKNSKAMNSNQEKKEQNNDVISMIEFENNMTICEDMMKLSANLHKEFWIELKEDQPDLRKLNVLGQRINKTTNMINESYVKMQKINPNIFQTIRVYGLFLIFVTNDKLKGRQFLRLAKQVQQSLAQVEDEESFSLENNLKPAISVSMIKHGVIVGMNQLVVNHLGYSKQELIGKSINQLMPKMYGEQHNAYLQQYLENVKNNHIESDYINFEQSNYFKHKNGYIAPMKYKVMLNLEYLQYFVTFESNLEQQNLVHFIIDEDTKIYELSTGAINIFGLDNKAVLNRDIKLNDLIPDIMHKDKYDIHFRSNIKNEERLHYLRCSIKYIQIRIATDVDENQQQQQQFYQITFQNIDKTEAMQSNKKSINRQSIDILKLNPTFQIYSAHQSSSFMYATQTNQQNLDTNLVYQMMANFQQGPRPEEIEQINNYQNREEKQIITIEQTIGVDDVIKTRRLINGQIVPIDEEFEEQILKELEEQEQDDSIFKNRNDFQINNREYKNFSKQKQQSTIVNALNTNHKHKQITKLKQYTLFYLIFFMAFAIYQFSDKQNFYEFQNESLTTMNYCYQINFELLRLFTRSIDHILVLKNFTQYKSEDINQDINKTIINLNDITLKSVKYDIFNDLLMKDEIDFITIQNDWVSISRKTRFDQAIILMETYAFKWISKNSATLNDIEIVNILTNFHPTMTQKLVQINTFLYEHGYEKVKGLQTSQIIQIILTLIISTFIIIRVIMFMIQVKQQRENIMFLFLAIPDEHLSNFQKNCEQFLKQFVSIKELIAQTYDLEASSDEEQEIEINTQVQEIKKQQEDDFVNEQNRKQAQKYKKVLQKYQSNILKGQLNLVLSVILIGWIILGNTLFQFFDLLNQQSFLKLIWPQNYLYQQFTMNYIDHLNIYNLMLLNSSISANGESIKVTANKHLSVFKNNQENLREFSVQVFDQFEEFTQLYNTIQYFMICDPIKDLIGEEEYNKCATYINTTNLLGIIAIEQYMYQFFERRQRPYLNLTEDFLDSPQLNESLLFEINYCLFNYIGYAIDYMIKQENIMVENYFQSSVNLSLLLTIIYVIVMFFFYILVALRYFNQINKETNQTIQMLNMIPIEVIKQNKNLREFVIGLIKMMDKQQYK